MKLVTSKLNDKFNPLKPLSLKQPSYLAQDNHHSNIGDIDDKQIWTGFSDLKQSSSISTHSNTPIYSTCSKRSYLLVSHRSPKNSIVLSLPLAGIGSKFRKLPQYPYLT